MMVVKYDEVEQIVRACLEFKEKFDIDMRCGRHSVDAFSFLGVFSFAGREVEVVPIIREEAYDGAINELFERLKPYGAYWKEEVVA